MTNKINFSRREALKSMLGGLVYLKLSPITDHHTGNGLKGNIRHSVSKWCFKYPLNEFCREVKKIGIESVEMAGPEKWPVISNNGLQCAVGNLTDLAPERGLNNIQWHENLIKQYIQVIPLAAASGVRKLICYSGNRAGMTDQQGLENCKKALSEILPLAEKNDVTLVMELIGKEFPDYQCNNIAWGMSLCDSLKSSKFRLLYDVANMHSTGADVINDIKKNYKYFAHYQIAGAPNRCEPDISKGLDCKKVVMTIAETGYTGFVGQEYWPSREIDRIERLRDSIAFCDI